VPDLSACANVFLGQTWSHFGFLSERAMRRRFTELSERLGVLIDPDAVAGALSVADQQMIEIMRALQSDARILLLDEPTSALAPPERTTLLRALAGLEPDACGRMWIDGKERSWPTSPHHALALGIALIPEDRKQGLVLSMTAQENIILANLSAAAKLGLLSDGRLREDAAAAVDGLRYLRSIVTAASAGPPSFGM
jgi:ABC-type sugar transport system ATPase subunit